MVDTLALAVDGMEPSLVSKWTDAGELPNVQTLVQEGAHGTAECTSLSSARQWTTHFTGVGPDRHGVEGFIRTNRSREAGDPAPDADELVNLTDVAVETYPELLSEDGLSVGLVNPLPIWPPLELDGGFCVSGLLTPPGADRWFDPPELAAELDELDYRIDVRYGDRPYGFVDDDLFGEVGLERLERDLFDVLDARIRFARHAIEHRDPDFLYVLCKSIDVFQHCFWAHMRAGDERFGDTILRAYRQVDEFVGWVTEQTTANVVAFGDHGFGPRREANDAVDSVAGAVGRRLPVPGPVRRLYEALFVDEVGPDGPGGGVGRTTGTHADPAAWIAAGPDVASRSDPLAVSFEDLTPTLLALLDVPIPEAYVGTPVEPALSIEPRYRQRSIETTRRRSVDDVVSDRLHNLGYAEMVDE